MEQTKDKKVFFYVFPTLKVEEDIQILFTDVEVKKITTNTRRDFLHVHILSRHLIQKRQIRLMERRIKDQLFGNVPVEVNIEEEYVLSGQYTPEALMNEYRESIIYELKEKSMLASNMFAQADVHYEEGGVMCLELLDTIVSEGRKEEILNLLKHIFAERFHIKADIRVSYREPDEAGTREYDEQRVQQEINAIFERRARQSGERSNTDASGTGTASGEKRERKQKSLLEKERQGETPRSEKAEKISEKKITTVRLRSEMIRTSSTGKTLTANLFLWTRLSLRWAR